MEFCRKILFAFFVVFCLQFVVATTRVNEIFAQENTVESFVSANVNLGDKSSTVKLNLEIKNVSAENIVTRYEFPNIWRIDKLNTINIIPKGRASVSLQGETIVISCEDSPLKPGENVVVSLYAEIGIIKKYSDIKSLIHADLSNNLFPSQSLTVNSYQISYPKEWGKFSFINLQENKYTLKEIGKDYQLNLGEIYQMQMLWGESLSLKVTQNFGDNNGIKPLYNKSKSQQVEIVDTNAMTAIYRDVDGNLFANYKEDSQNIQQIVNTRLDLSSRTSTQNQKIQQILDYDRSSLRKEGVAEFPLPWNLKLKLREIKSAKFSDTLDQVIETISQKYKVGKMDFSELAASDSGIAPAQQSINYLEYLLAVQAGVKELGFETRYVVVDKTVLTGGISMLLEYCNKQKCNYYNPAMSKKEYESRLASGLGLHLLAFDGVNQIAFASLKNISELAPETEEFGQGVLGENSREPQINLQIPDEISNFSNFTAKVSINNTADRIIFLDGVIIENRTFPIIDDSIGGLRRGVLPGEDKTLKIDNVFIPKVFLGDAEKVSISIDTIYEVGNRELVNNSQHKVLVKQNYFFWALALIAVISVIVSIIVIVGVYKNHKYVFVGSYWQARRGLSSTGWTIRQRIIGLRRRLLRK